ncbi:unnamed protein product [Prorocentrum cordatum]|uniref:Uncharacterized protein n=1 Tax=Prorocentrum cordatum TaxID=2364126 RepID=A0ABN9TCN1_9DINO|nr:unnamed protein product [Polarella glacialis]
MTPAGALPRSRSQAPQSCSRAWVPSWPACRRPTRPCSRCRCWQRGSEGGGVNEAAKAAHDLESTRRHLHVFFQRRRERLRMTTSMIACRMKRHVTDWVTAQHVAPHLHERLRLLEAEAESAEGRIRRLKPEAFHEAGGGCRDLPVGKASSGEPLFRGSGPCRRGALGPVFKSDVAVCLRELVFEDRATRTLRRFVRRMQHVPLSHRRQLWEVAERLQAAAGTAPRGSTRASPLPLKRVVMSEGLEARVRELAKDPADHVPQAKKGLRGAYVTPIGSLVER